MTSLESSRRPLSKHGLLLIAAVVGAYALGLFLWTSTAVARFVSGEHAVCGAKTQNFGNPGRMGWGHGLEPQAATGRLVVIEQRRFPYSLAGELRFVRNEYVVTALGLRPDDAGFVHVPRVDGHPLQVKRAFVWNDKVILWGAVQASPDAELLDVQYVLDAHGQERLVRDRQRLRALAIDASTRSLVSLEERVQIMGGQPREEERPPQALVFEPLDEAGVPQSEGAHRHPIRKLQNLLGDGRGNVFLIRWEAGSTSRYQSRIGQRLLEAYSIRERRILWSVQLDDGSVAEHSQETSRLVLDPAGVRFESDHRIPVGDSGREFRKKWRARIFDRDTGTELGEEISDVPRLDPDSRKEMEIAGRRYAIEKRGWRKECLAITPLRAAD